MVMETVLITGASHGIGAAAARLFAQNGYAVALNYCHSKDAALAIADELNRVGGCVLPIQADVSDSAQVDKMFDTVETSLGGVTVLINNAAIAQSALLTDTTDAMWHTMINTVLDGTFYCCRRALPAMIRRQSGVILNVSSIWGQVGAACEVAYSAAKSGVIGLTKALAQEVAPSGIRVNAIAPGVINTRMNDHLSDTEKERLCQEIPLGRFGTPEEVAQLLLFLAGPNATYFTGQIFSPNGGFVIT